MKKIIFHSLMVLLGVFGVFFGTLPDILPNMADSFLFGETRGMKTGYARIIEFTELPSTERKIDIALTKDSPGYFAILRILHSFNPKIVPSPTELKDYFFGSISTDRSSLGVFVNPGIHLTLNKEIYFQSDARQWKEVCEIRDLHYIIESSVSRYYVKIGFFLALLSILIEGFVSIRYAIVGKQLNKRVKS